SKFFDVGISNIRTLFALFPSARSAPTLGSEETPLPTPTERAIRRLPTHLLRYVVSQAYDAYTPRDQAVWRHIMGRLSRHLVDKAHPAYLEGLDATGIG